MFTPANKPVISTARLTKTAKRSHQRFVISTEAKRSGETCFTRAKRSRRIMALFILTALITLTLSAQQITGIQVPKKDHVAFSPEAPNETQTVAANKPTTVLLHFLIQPGFHINSHTPRNATLIATKLAVEDDATFNVKKVDFPLGHDYAFASDPSNKLDVYSGDFTLTAHVLAKPGTHTLKAALAYQACDTASCYPPRTLPVLLTFSAK